jgi:hypothetical protein
MGRFAVMYAFHQANAMSIKRLRQLKNNNTDVAIFPTFGVQQNLPIPSHMRVRLLGKFAERLNAGALTSSHFLRISRVINQRVESLRRHSELLALSKTLGFDGMTTYFDFTPMGDWNQDLAILNWFSAVGQSHDFEYLIFYEYDIHTTKTISSLYGPYTQYDAAFAHLRKATPSWHWYHFPPGSRIAMLRWLKKQGF